MSSVGAPATRRRRWPWLLALLVGSLLVTGLLLEIGFRLFWRLPPAFAEFAQQGLYVLRGDGSIGLNPGYRGTLSMAGRSTEVLINELGMRGPMIPPRQPGEQRWLLLGDSLVFGYGLQAAESLPAVLQQELRRAGVSATVGNAGVPGYGVGDAVRAMQALEMPFAADGFVLCSFLGNDALDDLRVDQTVAAGLRFDGPMARLVQDSLRIRLALHSRALLWLETWIFTNQPTASPLLQQAPSAAELAALAGLPGDYPTFGAAGGGLFLDVADPQHCFHAGQPPIVPRLLQNLRQQLELAVQQANGRPLWFVVLPPRAMVEEDLRQQRLRERGFDIARFPRGTAQARWLQLAADLGIPAVDATPLLAAAGPAAELFLDEGHLSSRGIQLLAADLAARLLR